jgi:hypothetical protein
VTLWEQEQHGRTIVHLANRTVPWTLPTDERQITEIVPLHDVRLVIRGRWRNPKVTGRGAGVSWRTEEDRLAVTVDKINAYAAVVVEEA